MTARAPADWGIRSRFLDSHCTLAPARICESGVNAADRPAALYVRMKVTGNHHMLPDTTPPQSGGPFRAWYCCRRVIRRSSPLLVQLSRRSKACSAQPAGNSGGLAGSIAAREPVQGRTSRATPAAGRDVTETLVTDRDRSSQHGFLLVPEWLICRNTSRHICPLPA